MEGVEQWMGIPEGDGDPVDGGVGMEQRARATTPASSLPKRRGSETGSSSDRDQKTERGDGIEGIQRPPGRGSYSTHDGRHGPFAFLLFFGFVPPLVLFLERQKGAAFTMAFFREGGRAITIIILIIIYLSHWGGLNS